MPKSLNRSSRSTHTPGFTIIELAIVMVVVGLLLGGILKGSVMIHQAKLRKTAQMVEDIRSASNLFFREQGRLPGDGIATGGLLDGWIKPTSGTEPAQFRRELISNRYLTGKLIGANDAEKWKNALGGDVWVEYRTTPAISNYIVVTGFSAADLTYEDQKFLDLQFDDGDKDTGNVRYVGTELLIPL